MNIMATVPVKAVTSTVIRQSRPVHYKITAPQNLLKRFQHFIETTDWEERYLCNRWVDKICLCGIAISLIYFTPVLAQFFLK